MGKLIFFLLSLIFLNLIVFAVDVEFKTVKDLSPVLIVDPGQRLFCLNEKLLVGNSNNGIDFSRINLPNNCYWLTIR